MKGSVYIGVSLDGFIAREDGDIGWLEEFGDEEAIPAYENFIKNVDVFVIGRGTFETVLSFPSWPYSLDAYLLSTTIKQLPAEVEGKITLLSMKPKEVMSYLSDKGYTNAYIDGGKVITGFLNEDLIDELIISKLPILIGSGIPLFGHLDMDLRFTHIKTEVHANGIVRSHYERKRRDAKG
jgi:dihydrofolate reductase